MKIPKVSIKQLNKDRSQVEWRNPGGRRRRLRVDSDIAENVRLKILQALIEGKNPEAEMEKANNRERAKSLKLKEFWHVFEKEHLPILRPNTQDLYSRLMEKTIVNYPIVRLPICEINRRAVSQYQQQRNGKASPATINREVQLIKSMLGRAFEWEILDRDPRPGMKLLKESNRRDVSNIKPEQIAALFESLPVSMANVCKFALYTGLRKENILNLQIFQVQAPDIGDVSLVLETKGGKQAVRRLGEQATGILRRAIGDRTEGYIFQSPRDGRYSSIHKTLDRYVRKLGIRIADGRKFCFHDFRRLYATWMLNSGKSLEEVQVALGHADYATTQRYATFVMPQRTWEPEKVGGTPTI